MEHSPSSSSEKDAAMKRRSAFEAEDDDEHEEDKEKDTSKEKDTEKDSSREETKKLSTFESLFVKPKEKEIAELSVDSLSEDENVEAAQKIITENKPEVHQELTDAEKDSVEELEAAADLTFLTKLDQQLEAGKPIGEAVDGAAHETVNALELSSETENIEDSSEEVEDDPNTPVNASTTTRNTTTSPTTLPTMPGITGGNNQPPPPVPSGPSRMPPGMPTQPPFGPPNPNVIHPISIQPTIEQQPVYDERRSRGKDLLVGGIVGYFIGRRRGRIKIEERLLPIQQKLEKEVRGLHDIIARKEAEVREIATKSFERATAEETKARREKIERLKIESLLLTRTESPEHSTQLAQKAPERITSFVIEKSSSPETITRKNAEQMSIPELLEIAEQVRVENVSLRTMYERGVLDQNSLRRAIKEHLQGNRIEHLVSELITGEERLHDMQMEGQPQHQSSHRDAQQTGRPYTASEYADTASAPLFDSNATTSTSSPPYNQAESSKQQAKAVWITLAVLASAAILLSLLI